MEDMSDILSISAIHIDRWTSHAYICRSRDEAEQALTCARSQMSQVEILPAAIFIRIVDEERSIITDRIALEELLLEGTVETAPKPADVVLEVAPLLTAADSKNIIQEPTPQ